MFQMFMWNISSRFPSLRIQVKPDSIIIFYEVTENITISYLFLHKSIIFLTGSPTVTVFTLDQYLSTSAVTAQLSNLSYSVNGVSGGNSDLTTPFNQVSTTVINQGSPGRRSGVPGVCFLLTTYPPATNRPTYPSARDALKAVCRVVILAVGSESVSYCSRIA